MKRSTNARIAGISFLAYIVFGLTSMIVSGGAIRGDGMTAKMAAIAANAGQVRVAAVLTLLCAFAAILLGVSLYAITRDEDGDIAMIGLACRVAEGVVGGLSVQGSLGLLWLATTTAGKALDTPTVQSVGSTFLAPDGSPLIAGMFFAVGSTAFTWLLMRGRMIPALLAWTGVAASILLVIALPLQLGGVIHRPVTDIMWAPMAAFEIPFAIWLLWKGVKLPRPVETAMRVST